MNPCEISDGYKNWSELNASLEGGGEFAPFWSYGWPRRSDDAFFVLHPGCTLRWEPEIFDHALLFNASTFQTKFFNEDGYRVLKEIQYIPKSAKQIARDLKLEAEDETSLKSIEEFLISLINHKIVFSGRENDIAFLTRKNPMQAQECKAHPKDEFKLPFPSAPFWTMIYLTYECNLNCKHCGVNRMITKKSLSGGQWIDIFNKLKDAGVYMLTLNGGEPLIHPDANKILEYLSKSSFYIRLFTNGSFLDKEKIDIISGGRGNFFLSISLDGATAATHDKFRGRQGSFDSVMKTFDLLNKASRDIPRYAACVINKSNLDELEDIMKLAVSRNLHGALFISMNRVGRAVNPEYYVSVQEHPEILEKLRNTAQIYKDKLFISIQGRGPALKEITRPIPRYHGSSFTCNAGILDWMIDPVGDIYPCEGIVTLPEEEQKKFYIGNIINNSIAEVWNSQAYKLFRGGYDENNLTVCKSCSYYDSCGQKKCRLYALGSNNDFHGPAYECRYVAQQMGIDDYFIQSK